MGEEDLEEGKSHTPPMRYGMREEDLEINFHISLSGKREIWKQTSLSCNLATGIILPVDMTQWSGVKYQNTRAPGQKCFQF